MPEAAPAVARPTAQRPVDAAAAHDAQHAIDYLRRPLRLAPLTLLLLLGTIFAFAADARWSAVFALLVAAALLAFLRAPRWACYLAVGAAVAIYCGVFVFSISNGARDADSERDDAVEIAATRFLSGENPWSARTRLKVRITTGPASVLLAAPAVALFGRVNELSYAFYLALFAILVAADVARRNDTFVPLALLFASGFLGFQHTLYWSLEELYYAYPVLALGWFLLARGQPVGCGLCLAFALGARLSYVYPVFGFLCWYWMGGERRAGELARLGAGAAAGTLLILAPFAIVGGWDFVANNPFSTASDLLARSSLQTNFVFRAMNALSDVLGPAPAATLKSIAALAIVAWAARRARSSFDHPFWHMCLGGVLADFLVYPDRISSDYLLFFSIPAFLATAHSRGFGWPIASEPAPQTPRQRIVKRGG